MDQVIGEHRGHLVLSLVHLHPALTMARAFSARRCESMISFGGRSERLRLFVAMLDPFVDRGFKFRSRDAPKSSQPGSPGPGTPAPTSRTDLPERPNGKDARCSCRL